MYPTAFIPIFLALCVYCWGSASRWAAGTLVASFFQAATPILIVGGGRVSGIQPAYALLPIGLLHLLKSYLARRPEAQNTGSAQFATACLWLLTLVGIAGALLMPRLLSGVAHVMPPRLGLDVGWIEPLRPSGGNIIQAFYMACNLALFVLVADNIRRGNVSVAHCIKSLAFGSLIAVGLGIYQVAGYYVGLPWPDFVINSNIGLGQQYAQSVLGTKRMSATFLEPSMMSMHFVGLLGLFGLGLSQWRIGFLLFACLILSTSASALAGVSILVAAWFVLQLPRAGLGTFASAAFLAATLAAVVLAVSIWGGDRLIADNFIIDKLHSESGVVRANADRVALNAFVESWGLGVGVGSTRASSFLATFAAGLGIPGILCLAGFLASLLTGCFRSDDRELRAIGMALIGMLGVWFLSVPDLAVPMLWLISGIAAGALALAASKRTSPSNAVVAPELIGGVT